MTGIHFYERSLISFGKAFPVVTAIASLITHVVRSDKYFVPFGFLFPVFDRSTFYKRCVKVVVECNMVTMLHTVSFIADKSKEFAFFIVFICHSYVFLISPFA